MKNCRLSKAICLFALESQNGGGEVGEGRRRKVQTSKLYDFQQHVLSSEIESWRERPTLSVDEILHLYLMFYKEKCKDICYHHHVFVKINIHSEVTKNM